MANKSKLEIITRAIETNPEVVVIQHNDSLHISRDRMFLSGSCQGFHNVEFCVAPKNGLYLAG